MKSPQRFLILVLLAALLAILSVHTANAQGTTPPDQEQPASQATGALEDLTGQLASLGGLSALITVLVNAGKKAGFVKDGQAQNWSAGLNLLALAALLALGIYNPGADLAEMDKTAGAFAQIGLVALTFVGQLAISQATHNRLRGIPIAGTSNPQP